ncbi:MAG TPA: hypothetical protein DHU63_09785 [Candidatus Marinimicrobia bacterium]|nr:MAG: hypothetical protein AUJ47_06420 [Candidatus Marinimicrobia bacterium CG1_02_48_14]HCW76812.1 hypothetical protein [Candidatus Neomarinimicrobiota bacterium]
MMTGHPDRNAIEKYYLFLENHHIGQSGPVVSKISAHSFDLKNTLPPLRGTCDWIYSQPLAESDLATISG